LEHDGYPFWFHFYHARTFWEFRHLSNIHFVHYNDLKAKADLAAEMRRIADFLGIEVSASQWSATVDGATFAAMRRDTETLLPEINLGFVGGQATTPGLARWLERGSAAGDPKSM